MSTLHEEQPGGENYGGSGEPDLEEEDEDDEDEEEVDTEEVGYCKISKLLNYSSLKKWDLSFFSSRFAATKPRTIYHHIFHSSYCVIFNVTDASSDCNSNVDLSDC